MGKIRFRWRKGIEQRMIGCRNLPAGAMLGNFRLVYDRLFSRETTWSLGFYGFDRWGKGFSGTCIREKEGEKLATV